MHRNKSRRANCVRNECSDAKTTSAPGVRLCTGGRRGSIVIGIGRVGRDLVIVEERGHGFEGKCSEDFTRDVTGGLLTGGLVTFCSSGERNENR